MNLSRRVLCTLLLFAVSLALPAVAQDTITIDTKSAAAGTTVDVPIYVRDVSGTPLGVDQPPGSRIQALSIKVNYAPATAVQSISIARAGITAPLTPLAEFTPSAPGTVSLITSFEESTDLIPFVSNASAPGNEVAHLLITVSSASVGQTITLTLDGTLTQLGNQAGTTSETSATGLTLVNGAVNVVADVPALSTIALLLLAAAFTIIALRKLV